MAALKIEHGTRLLTVEYLLGCRTVFGAVTTPLELRAGHLLWPFLLALWAFSPLGGQASLRIVWTGPSNTVSTANLTYLDFVSDYSNGGPGSASAEVLSPINSLYTSALITTAEAKRLPQDQYGNVKVPLYQDVQLGPVSRNGSLWYNVSMDDGKVSWSSLQGIPIHGIPTVGRTEFTLNTSYMGADCRVSKKHTPDGSSYRSLFFNYTCIGGEGNSCWSGASYMMQINNQIPGQKPIITFKSFNYWDTSGEEKLTIANCTISMNYVEVQVLCTGRTCRSHAIRPAQNLIPNPRQPNESFYSPLNGLHQNARYAYFLAAWINATNPSLACTAIHCPPSPMESYLYDPLSPRWGSTTFPSLWKISEKAFSERFTQLLNTYWIDSIAPYAVMGDLELRTAYEASVAGGAGVEPTVQTAGMSAGGYYLQWTVTDVRTPVEVMRCSVSWFVVLLVASLILVLASIATAVFSILRKGPACIDSFTSLLRWNRHVEIPEHVHSLDDSGDIARRLKNRRVLFGDAKPHEGVGYAALTVMGEDVAVGKIESGRLYA